MPQPQPRDDQKIDHAYVFGLLYLLCNAHRVCITVFIRRSFGTSAFEWHAVVALIIHWTVADLYPGFGLFFLFWLAALICQRIQSYRLRWMGILQHSRYQGYPWLAMHMPFIKSEHQARRFEPLLCLLLGVLVATIWDRLGLFIMAGFGSFGTCLVIETAILHQRMQAMVDADLELGYFVEHHRGRAI